jgi:hypothetical protein
MPALVQVRRQSVQFTDALLTDLLARCGWATHEHTLATWERTRTPSEVLAPLAGRVWPYLHQANPEQHAAGMAAAHWAAHPRRRTRRRAALLPPPVRTGHPDRGLLVTGPRPASRLPVERQHRRRCRGCWTASSTWAAAWWLG